MIFQHIQIQTTYFIQIKKAGCQYLKIVIIILKFLTNMIIMKIITIQLIMIFLQETLSLTLLVTSFLFHKILMPILFFEAMTFFMCPLSTIQRTLNNKQQSNIHLIWDKLNVSIRVL